MQTKQRPNAFKQRKLRSYEEISQEKSRSKKDDEDADEDKDMNERLGASIRKRKCNRSAKFGSDRYCGVYAIYEKNMLFLATFYFLPQLLVCGVVYLFLCVVCKCMSVCFETDMNDCNCICGYIINIYFGRLIWHK